jgi:hypothetical protein
VGCCFLSSFCDITKWRRRRRRRRDAINQQH